MQSKFFAAAKQIVEGTAPTAQEAMETLNAVWKELDALAASLQETDFGGDASVKMNRAKIQIELAVQDLEKK